MIVVGKPPRYNQDEMKSKDLIAQLQEIDPDGETEVFVGGDDIYFAEVLPWYWDGRPARLVRNEDKKPYYHIDGFIYGETPNGKKIRLNTMSMGDVLFHNPDAETQVLGTDHNGENAKMVERIREDNRRLLEHCKDNSISYEGTSLFDAIEMMTTMARGDLLRATTDNERARLNSRIAVLEELYNWS